jgi:hypothetical protein
LSSPTSPTTSNNDPINEGEDGEEYDLFNEFSKLKKSLIAFLLTDIGGNKAMNKAKQFARVFTNFLKYSFERMKNEDDNWCDLPLTNSIREIIENHLSFIGDYLQRFDKSLKAGGILGYLNYILWSVRWFHLYSDYNRKKKGRQRFSIYEFEDYMKRLTSSYKKALNMEKRLKTHEALLEQGKLPRGGLKELLAPCRQEMVWAMTLNPQDFKTRKIFNKFMEFLFCTFYSSAVQGRVGGFEDLKYGQRYGLMDKTGHVTTNMFKTAKYYNFQSVSSSELAAMAFHIYITMARRSVASVGMYGDSSPLWLTFEGIREYRIGKRVTKFYKRLLGLHITTTAIRGLYETESTDLYEDGKISLRMRQAISNIGGHSGHVVEKHYQKRGIERSTREARKFMNILHGDQLRLGLEHGVENGSHDYDDGFISDHAYPSIGTINFEESYDVKSNHPSEKLHHNHRQQRPDESVSQQYSRLRLGQRPNESVSTSGRLIGSDIYHEKYNEDFIDSNASSTSTSSPYSSCSFGGKSQHDAIPRKEANRQTDISPSWSRSPNRSRHEEVRNYDYDDDIDYGGDDNDYGGDDKYDNRSTSASFSRNSFDVRSQSNSIPRVRKEANRQTDISPSWSRSSSDRWYKERSSHNHNGDNDDSDDYGKSYVTPNLQSDSHVAWTQEEIHYTQKVYDEVYDRLPPENRKFITSQVFKHIKDDPDAVDIFHPNHLTDSSKLRHVIRNYIKAK